MEQTNDQVDRAKTVKEGAGAGGGEDPRDARIAELEAEVAELKKGKKAAQAKARAAQADAPAKARKFGRMDYPDGPPSPAELRELLKDAETVEVVLSDGKQELLGAGPFSISGNDPWSDTPAGLKLNVDDMTVHGPGLGSKASAMALAGYALVVDGKQVAWAQRPEQLSIGVGSTYQLKDDVIF